MSVWTGARLIVDIERRRWPAAAAQGHDIGTSGAHTAARRLALHWRQVRAACISSALLALDGLKRQRPVTQPRSV
jgi:hypothetical protein